MNRKVQILILSIVSLMSGPWTSELAAICVGNIQFPRDLKEVPSLRVYFAGKKIACDINNESKQTTFSIHSYQRNTPLYILVTEHLHWRSGEENTIKYLKTDISKPYKLYLATPHESLPGKKREDTEAHWNIQEITLDTDGKLSDFDTIIVFFNPDLIETLEGGNSITLPSLRVYSDILERVGSERELHAMNAKLLITALDSDCLHKPAECIVERHYQLKTVLALTT